MKPLTWLLYIAIFAITGVLIGFVRYPTGSPPKPVTDTAAIRPAGPAKTRTVKKKSCGYCAKRYTLQQDRIK